LTSIKVRWSAASRGAESVESTDATLANVIETRDFVS